MRDTTPQEIPADIKQQIWDAATRHSANIDQDYKEDAERDFYAGAAWAYRHLSSPVVKPQGELIKRLKEYIEFLGQHTAADAGFKAMHGIRISPEEFTKGERFRAEIAKLESSLSESPLPIEQEGWISADDVARKKDSRSYKP